MARIAATEDVEGIRDEEDVGDVLTEEPSTPEPLSEGPRLKDKQKGKYVATLQEVQEAFDAVNTLRYSQPTHLQGLHVVAVLHCPINEMNPLRQMPGFNDHSIQRGAHSRWNYMENSLPVIGHYHVRGEYESYEGAAS